MPARIKIEDLNIEQIKEDFYNGITIRDLASKLSISEPSVRNILKELELIRLGRISQKDIDNVLRNRHYRISKIVYLTGLDKTTVKKILVEHHISPVKITRTIVDNVCKISRYQQFKDNFTPNYIEQLLSVSLYRACMTTGFSEPILRRYAAEYNIKFTKAFVTMRDVSLDDQNRIKKMYIDNLYTNKEIQAMFSVGARTLRKITSGLNKDNIDITEFENYKKLVRRLTTVVKNLYNILPESGYHVDHKLSVYDGFQQGIPGYLIASAQNLEIILSKDNLQKGSSSSITKDELYRLHGII